jgi:hypothetical protein
MKSKQMLDSFLGFCIAHPELRFWQALAQWSETPHLVAMTDFDYEMFNHEYIKKRNVKIRDTFYIK